jgi:site-specific DNA recombinase
MATTVAPMPVSRPPPPRRDRRRPRLFPPGSPRRAGQRRSRDPRPRPAPGSYNDLEAEKTAALAAVADLDAATPTGTGPGDVTLLDRLPHLRLNLTDAPTPLLRALFDATRLTIDMHEDSDDVTLTISLPAGDLPAVAEAARDLAADQGEPGVLFGDVVRAPGGIRTHTGRCLRALSLPVGLQGPSGEAAACGA